MALCLISYAPGPSYLDDQGAERSGLLPEPNPQFGELLNKDSLSYLYQPGPGTNFENGLTVIAGLFSLPILNACDDIDNLKIKFNIYYYKIK